MPNPELDAEFPEHDDSHSSGALGERNDLKIILDAIASQLSDADRRYSATLNEMQDRIAGMGREAETLRHRVPDQFAPAFDRIEMGVAELAHRLSGVDAPKALQSSDALRALAARQSGIEDFLSGTRQSEMPMALRSAGEALTAGVRRREEFARRASGVDTFDVIESSVAGNAADPWDRDAIEALSQHFDPAEAMFTSRPTFAGAAHSDSGDFSASSHSAAGSASGVSAEVDRQWLESRFAEIAKGIEQSIADIRPDHGFFALGQRLDQFEQQFAKMFQDVATHADMAAIRAIEDHMGEVVNHLVQTHDQLERLNVIEEQLSAISHSINAAQGAQLDPHAPTAANGAGPSIDVDAIARAAAEQTAQRFADMRPIDASAGADELRPLIERLMSENRQGEENTAALLDTLQHAMIRLLDRVESIEMSQRTSVPATPDQTPAQSDEMPFHIDSERLFGTRPGAPLTRDTPVAESGPAKTGSMPMPAQDALPERTPNDMAPRRDEKQRQDFVAEARRAKMRLAAAEQADDAMTSAPVAPGPVASVETAKAMQSQGSRPIRPSVVTVKPAAGPTGPSPRLIIIALIAISALGWLWYSLNHGGNNSAPATPAGIASPSKPAPGAVDQPADPMKGTQTAPDGTGPRGDAAPAAGTEGEIISGDASEGMTTLPMIGVAVDTERPVTAADLEQARRHQAMATMSGQIGDAVARSRNQPVIPASMVPSERETSIAAAPGDTVPLQALASKSVPLDMPAATVGPLSLRLAAANGDPSAQFEVGARFAEGKGTPQNFKEAAKWYQLSADRNFAQAQYRLGTLYERGLGVKADRAQAAVWYQRAAEQGSIKAMHNLAVLSADQSDNSPDYVTAAHWFEEAAKRGLADSQFNLAVLYENGLGVKADMAQAFKWLSLAARDGDKEAVRRRDILRGKLSAQEVAAADQMVAAWRPAAYDRAVNDARTAGDAWKQNPKNGVSG